MTVFRGTQPERFDVEVIDVLHNFQPDQDLILVRTSHPILDKAIVVAGHERQPGLHRGQARRRVRVRLDVRQGAGRRRHTDREHDGGDRAADRSGDLEGARHAAEVDAQAARNRRRARSIGGPTARTLGPSARTRSRRCASTPPRAATRPTLRTTTPTCVPAATPIMLSGLDDRVARMLDRELARFGLVTCKPAARRARRQACDRAAAFEDGGAIGVELVRGDINGTAIGTVTHVAGNRLVAFGHPMMNAGQPALPTCTARVLHVLANERRSFKIAEAIQSLGTLIHDRQAAIVVDTQIKADSVPVRVRVNGVSGARRTEWNVQVASNRLMTPLLTFARSPTR